MSTLLEGPLPLFVVQAILVIVTSRALGAVARRFGQPMVVAEIVAGIVLGPSLLGWLLPGFEAAVFPAKSMQLLGLLSQIGLILFMFLVGLEFDPKMLKGRTRSSVAISHTSIVVPFALGALLAWHLHGEYAPSGVPLTSFTLFMGTAMSITAFPVLARILTERNLLRSRVGTIAITCAAVDDITAWCILAFVVAIARSATLTGAVRTSALTLLYITVMFLAARPLLRRWLERIHVGLTQNLIAVALVLLLLSSWVTELIGIHALFGAFLFGAILPKEGNFAANIAHKLGDLVVVLMLPLFFAYSGLRTQLGLLSGTKDWIVCAGIVVLACIGKFGGSTVAARLTGLPWRESSAIGTLMNTRGLMELVVLNIGLDLGVLSPVLFTMMVIMALVTTLLTTPVLQSIYPVELLRESVIPTPDRTYPAAEPP
ncbi:cation:proton antiporter [Pendulispora albinea]|uniref:cation:proton antiporter domain-containing protein n=1 Tax=Pendulispora albinea TaxID=2741071 RepID=UPI00374DFC7D